MPAPIGDNNPPFEMDREEAQFVFDVLDRDLGQGLAILALAQAGKLSREDAEKVVAYNEKAKPVHRRLKEYLK